MERKRGRSQERNAKRVRHGALLFAAALAGGCAGTAEVEHDPTALERAVEAAERGDWARAETLLEPIVPSPPDTSGDDDRASLATSADR